MVSAIARPFRAIRMGKGWTFWKCFVLEYSKLVFRPQNTSSIVLTPTLLISIIAFSHSDLFLLPTLIYSSLMILIYRTYSINERLFNWKLPQSTLERVLIAISRCQLFLKSTSLNGYKLKDVSTRFFFRQAIVL